MDRSVSLGVFGCIHVDDTEKVTAELSAFREDGDAIFIEYPSGSKFGFGDPRKALLYPLELLAYLLLVLLHGPLSLLFNRDIFPAEYTAAARLAEEDGVSLHAVDTPFLEYPRGWKSVVLNWAVLAVFGWLAPTTVGLSVAAILAAGIVPGLARRLNRWLGVLTAAVIWGGAYAVFLWQISFVLVVVLLVLVVALFARLVHAHEFRNEQMVGRVDSIAASQGYDRAVLVTGRAHVLGIVCSAALYHPLSVIIFGRTLGQRVTNLAVAAADGTVPGGYSLAVKHLLRPLEYLLFPVTLLTMFLTAQKQRPAELLAGTVVGRTKRRRAEESTETTAAQQREPAEASPEAVD